VIKKKRGVLSPN